jgi:formylglycine-generating enzyme required for sulfatase activity
VNGGRDARRDAHPAQDPRFGPRIVLAALHFRHAHRSGTPKVCRLNCNHWPTFYFPSLTCFRNLSLPGMKTPLSLSVATLLLVLPGARAAVDFEKDVKPILEIHCVRCHNPKGTDYESGKTDVDLATHDAAFEVVSTIVPGKPEKSKLYTTTILPDDANKLMPPKNKVTGKLERISPQQSETLRLWILEGATWPKEAKLVARKLEVAPVGGEAGEKAVVNEIHQRIVTSAQPVSETGMQPYSITIAGSDTSFDLVPIPGGKFKMGSPETEAGRKPDEGPVHEVEIAPFWMGKHEVTWNEFELFMYPDEEKKTRAPKQLDAALNRLTDAVTHPTQPYVEMSFGMGKEGFPAISMTQHAANKYCQWLSAKTGSFFRLPTEAEWEYAARAGTTTAYFWGDDASKIGEYCWWGKNSDFKYQKVGKKKPNAWGLYDMLGNVIEWTLDQYDPGFYATSKPANPWNKATQPYPHAARGGSWDDDDPSRLRVAARRGSGPEWKIQDPQLPKSVWYHTDAQFLGFRIVRPLKTPSAEEMDAYWNSGVEKD